MDDTQPQQPGPIRPTTDFEQCQHCKRLYRRTLKTDAPTNPGLISLRRVKDAWDKPAKICDECEAKITEQENRDWQEKNRRQLEAEQRAAAYKAEQEKKAREKRMIEALDATKRGGARPFKFFTFENFKPELSPKWHAIAKGIADSGSMDRENVYVYGPTGTGKTFLSTALVRLAWDQGDEGAMFTLATAMALYYDKLGSEQHDALGKLLRFRYFGLDDLGLGTVTETKIEFLEHFLDGWLNCEKTGLVITSNYELNKISELYTPRIADRIYDLCRVIEIPETTASARGLKKKKK